MTAPSTLAVYASPPRRMAPYVGSCPSERSCQLDSSGIANTRAAWGMTG